MGIPPFDAYLGNQLIRKEDGAAEVSLELREHHLNERGVAHGGVISALLDSALGSAVIAAIPADWWCATTSLSTQFVDGAREGPLSATGRVVSRGARVAFAAGEVRDARGKLIATASGTWHLWPFRPGEPRAPGGPAVFLRDGGARIRVGKILAVGRNYAEHIAEMGSPPAGEPVIFLKPPSSLVHDGGTVTLPEGAGRMHHEVELVVVIGRPGKSIRPEEAHDHILGYAVGLDLTLRDVQGRAKERGEPWCVAKGFDGSAPVSDVAPKEEVGDGTGLEISLSVNGEVRQQGNSSMMLRGVGELIAFVSRWFRLERGDLLFTGTPSGVGPLAAGDRVEARIEKVGMLTFRVEAGRSGG